METVLWELIERSKDGDQEALMTLIKKFDPLIKKYTKELNYEEAETDLIISFIELIKDIKLNIFPEKNDGLVVNYIVKSLNHKKINLFRKYVINMEDFLEVNMDLILDESDMKYKSRIIFEDLINCLPKLQRRVIKEKFLLGYSYKEIGDRLNITRQAVNRIKNRALNNLRETYMMMGDNEYGKWTCKACIITRYMGCFKHSINLLYSKSAGKTGYDTGRKRKKISGDNIKAFRKIQFIGRYKKWYETDQGLYS